MAPGIKNQKNSLGRALIKQKNRELREISTRSELHALKDSMKTRDTLESATEFSDIGDLMSRIEMKEHVLEHQVQLLTLDSSVVDLTPSQKCEISKLQSEYSDYLRIPRRPQWDNNTTPEQLHKSENENFAAWRLQLDLLKNVNKLTVTPYEKNLQIWRQLWRVVERSDVVVQIVDGRNPLMFRCSDLEEYVREVDAKKINLLLVNKSDFLTEEQREKWTDYFNETGTFAVFFSALCEKELEDIKEEVNIDVFSNSSSSEQSFVEETYYEQAPDNMEGYTCKFQSECFDDMTSARNDCAEESVLKSYPENDIKQTSKFCTSSKLYNREEFIDLLCQIAPQRTLGPCVVGLVGYPNVGKSSTINALLQKKRVTVSSTPGKTKHFQTIQLNSDITLCDCPGLVFPGFVSTRQEMLLWGILPVDRIRGEYDSAISVVCNTFPPHVLQDTYSLALPAGISRPPTAEELLSAYSLARSFMSARGRPDTSRAARNIVKDFMTGRLLHCVAPPTVEQNAFFQLAITCSTKQKVAPMTSQQKVFMPETTDEVEVQINRMFGIDEENLGQNKSKKDRMKKPKGQFEIRVKENGEAEVVLHKPWRNKEKGRRTGKINPNNHNPYGNDLW